MSVQMLQHSVILLQTWPGKATCDQLPLMCAWEPTAQSFLDAMGKLKV